LWGTDFPTGASTSTVDCPLRFPGQYADPETGLHYNYIRHYDPETARYAAPDPLGLAPAPNPTTYIPNPYSWIDPLGLKACGPKGFEPGAQLGETSKLGGWIPKEVPDEAMESINDVKKYGRDATGWGAQWHGPNLTTEPFSNSGKNGAYRLPTHDASGNPITYREYGAPASSANPKPGGERTVWGSDGSIYYTPTHYQTYIVVESPKW
ncbi:RHS repeat-associated core domain-containing protein, partial [Streptomyces asiaticus]